jgi:hypothetical protein
VKNLQQKRTFDVVHPVVSIELLVIVGEGIATVSKGCQGRRFAARIRTEPLFGGIVAQEIPSATHLCISGHLQQRSQPSCVDGVVRVHAGHRLIVVAGPTAVPLVLNDDLGPFEFNHTFSDIRRTLCRAEEYRWHVEAAHAWNKETAKKLESAIEPRRITVSLGSCRILWARH